MKENNAPQDQPCCGPAVKEKLAYIPVPETGRIATAAGEVVSVSTEWSLADHLGAAGVRLGIRRMSYAVAPGLYAVGKPDTRSPVIVSANYKLSFDVLRRELKGLNVWMLVLDTKGINVWCAAGKGTFGTMELSRRVMMTGLEKVVSSKKLIVPQLGAPGISAHMVKAFCDFTVVYGPVRACDIKKFLDAGMKADTRMRRVTFGLSDRIAVSWLEVVPALKPALIVIVLAASVLIADNRFFHAGIGREVMLTALLFLVAILSGTVLHAALLPCLPGRAFSFKGGFLSLIVTGALLLAVGRGSSALAALSFLLFMPAVSAFLALNFTGASTFTSLSGVNKEIKYSLPVMKGMAAAAVLLQLGRFL